MHAFQWFDGVDVWQVAGWTMLHFLWAGALAGLIAAACRLVLRRASANVRYVAALACLAVLAALPVGIGAWLVAKPQTMRTPASTIQPVAMAEAPRPEAKEGIDLAVTHLDAPSVEGATGSASDRLELSAPVAGSPSLPQLAATISQSVAGYLPWFWIIGTPLTFVLLATGVVGAERLRRSSRVLHDGPIAEACARLVESLRIGRRATVAVCERIAAPVLVGIVRPIILLPPAAITGWSPDEIEMVLLHELAHVRRWDNLVNLVQRIVESVLFFHPAVWLVSNWVRHEREACCDAVVVGCTNRPHAYAELLIELAALMSEPSEPGRPRPRFEALRRGRGRPGSLVSSAMAAGPLRIRIRRILSLEDDPMLISGKSLGVVMSGLLLLVTLVVLNLPVRGQAKESTLGATGPALDQAGGLTSVADALGEYRRAVVGYDLDFDSVFPDRGWVAYDAKRLERYPTPDAWPDVLGHVDTDADKFRVVTERPAEKFQTATAGNAYLVPLNWSVGTEGYATLLFLRGIAADAHVVAHSYSSFACFGTMAGDVLFKSYATALVQGDMPGQITGDSYFNLVVTGKFTGRLYAGMYAMIYLVGGFDGDLELERSKVYIAGHTPRSALQRIKGTGKIYLEESDLAPGEHKIGDLVVTVKGREFAAVEGPKEDDGTTSNVAKPASALPPVAAALASLEDREPVPVPFVVGTTRFADGDKITITEVRGTANTFEPGNTYRIKGTYTLASRDRASLSANVTARTSANARTFGHEEQSTVVERGSGEFTLKLPMRGDGWPHVSFYPTDGGQSFGGIYFGTGDSVLKKPWGSNEVDERALAVVGTPYDRAKFPSLEDQKRADAAYKRLGLELEAIGEEDLKRVQAIGYDGGVLVTQNNGTLFSTERARGIVENDIIVGLHIWPTKSLSDVLTVLDRDDLAELNPLKYYVVRQVENGGGYGGRVAAQDVVVTGRVSVRLPDDRQGKTSDQDLFAVPGLPRVEAAAPVPNPLGSSDPRALETSPSSEKTVDEALASDPKLALLNKELTQLRLQSWNASEDPRKSEKLRGQIAMVQQAIKTYRQQFVNRHRAAEQDESTLRYEGKTFGEWRTAWQTELSTEKRLEAVNALAAFGANGHGKQAAESIVELAGRYDWAKTAEAKSNTALLNACASALGITLESGDAPKPLSYQIPTQDALPVLLEAAKNGSPQQKLFLTWVLPKISDPRATEALLELAHDPDAQVRLGVLLRLPEVNAGAPNDKVIELIRQALKDEYTPELDAIVMKLVHYRYDINGQIDREHTALYYLPELFPNLFNPNERVRRAARLAIRYLQPADVPTVTNELIKVLEDSADKWKQVEAIRALSAIGPPAKAALPALDRLIDTSDTAFVPALLAKGRITEDPPFLRNLLDRPGAKAFHTDVDLDNAYMEESFATYPPATYDKGKF